MTANSMNAPVEIRAAALIAAAQLIASGKVSTKQGVRRIDDSTAVSKVAADIVNASEDKLWRKGESDFLGR